MRRVDVVYAILTDDTKMKVLMVKNTGRDTWSLPGGAVEPDETLEEAVIREAKEETGYDIEVFGIMAVNEAKLEQYQDHAIFITFRGQIIGGTMQIERPDEISAIEWVPLEQADERMPYYKGGLSSIIRQGTEVPYYDEGRS